ncbi:LuxR family transcriptional regulator [Clostridium carboxidivorans P7]|uniref:ATP-dependent transcriptional regulator, MalT-like, LuxR family n=1 Tax=Clostridium carboxidivorans P7 TaxID=536227 RepID=C6PMR7_9CLOT|nr:LuxR C-terminal-related transcriptional regulator [Clostridium carboxidivorans]AKN29844.1 LuxR family transcriptional regulator [Clostridium carboxidivorans P7]EET89495.1 ATP-dependent transcriptional regulator, MalT-like, LuxR family [Clostridium carboxidivorans P7]
MESSKILKRERINRILSKVYEYPLTIIEAPMGFGKTTAVKEFLQSEKNLYIWITFLNSSQSLNYIWNQFSEEISKLDAKSGKSLKSLGFPVDVPQSEKVLSVLNNIDYKEKTVFVIDDYQLCPNPKMNNFITKIVKEKIDNFYIIIITRDTTKINLSEFLFKDMCQIISQQQLRFTKEELREYCLMMKNNIPDDDLIKINEYTDGWISLAYMILLGLEKGIPVGMNSTIDDLVENTLFNIYGENIQNFLLKLSVMDNFTINQAFYITQEEKTDEILKKLRKENAFVFYDEASKIYKIHNVLLDFLRIKFSFKAKELKEVYRRLAEWYMEKRRFQTAFGYLYRAGDEERILLELNKPENAYNESLFEGYLDMFSKISEELIYKYPVAYLRYMLCYIVAGQDIETCMQNLERLQLFYEKADNIEVEYRDRILAEILIIKKFAVFNDLEKMCIISDKARSLLKGKQSYILLRENEFTFGSPHLLYIYFRKEQTLKRVLQVVVERMPLHAKLADGNGTGCEYLGLAEYALETGDFEAAEINSFKAIYKAKTKTQTGIIINAYFNLMRLYIFQGKIGEAIQKLNKLQEKIDKLNHSIYNTTIDLCRGYIYACIGQRKKIPYWLQIGDMTAEDFVYQGMAFSYIVYGKAVMLSKNYIKLEMLAESFVEPFSIFNNEFGFIHNSIFDAVAKYNLYGMEEGVAVLEKALLKAQSDNIVMPFVENASHIMSMLEVILNRNLKNKYIKRVIDLSKQYNENILSSNEEKVKLSQREIEILTLTVKGLKRSEIAAKLNISEGTVKTHLQNIYKKLQVSGKFEAIKIAQMYGIV